jgi:hypothetical protein
MILMKRRRESMIEKNQETVWRKLETEDMQTRVVKLEKMMLGEWILESEGLVALLDPVRALWCRNGPRRVKRLASPWLLLTRRGV